MKRGVKNIIKILSTILLIISGHSFAQTTTSIRYTAPSNMLTLNQKNTGNYYMNIETGASHIILKEIFKNTKINLTYNVYNSYNENIENSKLYLTSSNILDLIIGIPFDENNLEYLNYIPTPILNDYMVIAIDKNSITDKTQITKDLNETITNLTKTNPSITINGLNLPLLPPIIYKGKDITSAMEKVYNEKYFLITPWEFMGSYIKNNKDNKNLKTIQILKYPKNQIQYLIAINKNTKNDKIIENGETYTLYDFINKRLTELTSTGELTKIINSFK